MNKDVPGGAGLFSGLMGANVTQITDEFPDLLGPYFVRFGPDPRRAWWRIAAQMLSRGAIGAGVGWLGAQSLAGNVHPVFGLIWPIFLIVIFYPNLAMKMSHDISRARMFHAIAVAYVVGAQTRELLLGPREELGAQTL